MMKEHDNYRTHLAGIEKRLRTSAKEMQDKKELVSVQVNITFFVTCFNNK
jgi:hypothetical protein